MILAAVLLVPCVANATEVKKLELKCLDPQEFSNDNIYVEFYVDGQKVPFKLTDQRGTYKNFPKTMSKNSSIIFNAATRAKIEFSKELRIKVMERDPGGSDTLADFKLPLNSYKGSKTITGKVGLMPYHYRMTWTIN